MPIKNGNREDYSEREKIKKASNLVDKKVIQTDTEIVNSRRC